MHVHEITGKRILFGVLNWGLGHASRSTVLIEKLVQQQNSVELVSSGQSYIYLIKRFPKLVIHNLDFPELVYPSHNQLWMGLLRQQKKIFNAIRNENKWLAGHLATHKADLVISDNCYGFYAEKVHSIFISHQLNIKAPFFEKSLHKKIISLIEPFHEIWIPDVAGELNLAGELSHPAHPQKKCTYIGVLSQLEKKQVPLKYAYCAVISGPEKQRSVFEKKVLSFLKTRNKPAVIIRGTFLQKPVETYNLPITVHKFLQGHELAALMNESETIIARSGYSTIMDLFVLQKNCLLVPTPGQSEQEYLFKKHTGNTSPDLKNAQPVIISLCKG